MRLLQHTGTPLQPRIASVPARCSLAHVSLRPRQPLLPQLLEVLTGMGSTSGFAELYSGSLDPVVYCVPREGDAERAVGFSEERRAPNVAFVAGSATIGTRFGEPFLHCHSFWIDAAGHRRGGHVFPDTVVGSTVSAAVFGLHGAEWRSADDPETNMPVFTPYEGETTMPQNDLSLAEIIVSRILPNQDITQAATEICERAGWDGAIIRAGLGSLIGGAFIDPATGERHDAPGPGTEVISLVGHLARAGAGWSGRLSCTLVDREGEIHAGELIPGENPVAVTFELTLLRVT